MNGTSTVMVPQNKLYWPTWIMGGLRGWYNQCYVGAISMKMEPEFFDNFNCSINRLGFHNYTVARGDYGNDTKQLETQW